MTLGILLILCLIVANGVALLSSAQANVGPILYSAGEKIYRDGQVIGCRCPKDIGECICEWQPNQP